MSRVTESRATIHPREKPTKRIAKFIRNRGRMAVTQGACVDHSLILNPQIFSEKLIFVAMKKILIEKCFYSEIWKQKRVPKNTINEKTLNGPKNQMRCKAIDNIK